jgi:hypothetical protein
MKDITQFSVFDWICGALEEFLFGTPMHINIFI